jgi:hypothetical protein
MHSQSWAPFVHLKPKNCGNNFKNNTICALVHLYFRKGSLWGIAHIAAFCCDYLMFQVSDYFLFIYQWPYEAAALAFEAIPRTLLQNCGLNVIRTMTQLQGKVIAYLFIDI